MTPSSITQTEAKMYKRLYELYRSALYTIHSKARDTIEYSADNADRHKELLTFIGDTGKWDYCGIQSKENSTIIKELEKCLDHDTK